MRDWFLVIFVVITAAAVMAWYWQMIAQMLGIA